MGQRPESETNFSGTPGKPRLLDRVREAIRRKHYSRRTEEAYIHWIKRFIYYTGKRHPAELGATEVTSFLNHLSGERHVASATQNQALSALLFLYKEALGQTLPWLDGLDRVKRSVRLPVVLSEAEVRELLAQLHGMKWLMASLLYGAGLRLRECLMLRVKDVDFSYRQILVREGKGGKDRVTMLPEAVMQPLHVHLGKVHNLHRRDVSEGYGDVWLPDALARKYPRAGYEWGMNKGGRGVTSPLDHDGPVAPPQAKDIAEVTYLVATRTGTRALLLGFGTEQGNREVNGKRRPVRSLVTNS